MKLHEVSPLTQQQIEFLNKSVEGTWSYNNQTKAVDVTGGVHVPDETTSIPVQFGNVTGDFYCHDTNITSLQGAPQSVGRDFTCNHTKITSLQHAPQSVGRSFCCHDTKITSLQYAPQSVGRDFTCSHTKITSLQHAPQFVGGSFYCHDTNITSLQHAPQSVGSGFWCHNTNITSLRHAPQLVGCDFLCNHTNITSLQYLPIVKGTVYIINTPYERQVAQHILQLFKVRPRIKRIRLSDNQLADILNKYLPTGDVLACQEELIDAGYGKIARF